MCGSRGQKPFQAAIVPRKDRTLDHIYILIMMRENPAPFHTLVNVYVDLLVFTRIAGTS